MAENLDINITESAANKIGVLLKSEAAGARLRVMVEGGGCNGFQYKFDFDTNKNNDDVIISGHGAEVLVDETSVEYLKGSVIDYIESLGFSHFEIKNPNAASSCGCGNSFSV